MSESRKTAIEFQTRSVKDIVESLFQKIYNQDFPQKLEECRNALDAIGQNQLFKKIGSVDDDEILDEISQILLLHTEEQNREYHEKSLDVLCSEYAELNGIDASTIQRLKGQIINIRLLIEDVKKGKDLPLDNEQQYPIGLIADICSKIENEFGDMLRDTQLLAILSMLDSSNPRGGLSQLETGEGKTYVIVALAIIKNKQGEEVDIITSSPTLARRDVEKFKNFYKEQFDIFCSHNCDSDKGMMANPCYQPNSIVYGTTASFEGDSLRSEFYQADTFNGRGRGIAIIDEADSALLDKASWLCQISDSVAGMSTVRPLLYYIWGLVVKKVDEVKEKKFETKESYDFFLEEIKAEITTNLEEFFSGGDQSFVIPDHLKEFAKYRISFWIDSALRAIFYTHNREYNACKIINKITPIDYANTGEWEKDVQWEDALHQFLQMKSGMSVETETLTKSFMSNYTLINKYSAIYGLSGTLGEADESKTLKDLYGVSTRKIPKFKTSRYEEKPTWISPKKESWLNSLYADVVTDGLEENASPENDLPSSTKSRSRASLIICKTIADVEEVEQHFKKKGINHSDIFTYTKGDEDKGKIKEATKGKIIIATNLSGRGTDIEASSIEEAGGLHVIFSFLPSNKRIQDQGFGRTARKGLSGTARLVIQQEEIKEYHLKKDERSLLAMCNDPINTNLKNFKLSFSGVLWEVESDAFNDSIRELKVKKAGDSSETKVIQLSYLDRLKPSSGLEKQQKTYNAVTIDGVLSDQPDTLQLCSFSLTYESIMDGRDEKEENRLESLRSNQKHSLITKQALFEGFQRLYHNISKRLVVEERLESIHSNLLKLYQLYVLDEWAIFLDRVNKDLQKPLLEYFDYALDLNAMVQKNDLYKMQYINASIDVNDRGIRDEADAYYAQRGEKIDLTGAFACYNRVFITLKNNKSDIEGARGCLNRANSILEKGKAYEEGVLRMQHAVCCPDASKMSQKDVEGSPILRLILTMKALVKRNLEELDGLAKDYSKLKISFTNPYELKENPPSSTEKNDDKENGYTIPDDLMHEAIKLGLKGPLKLEGEGSFWQALLCAIISIVIAIAAIAAIAFSGGAAAPLVALLGGKLAFGIIVGAVAGAAISGAINSIKGAVNGDFSINKFGKDVLTGIITGAVGGGIGGLLSGAAAGVLQTASTLLRVGINAGIGGVSGASAGMVGYLAGAGIHGRNVSWNELGKAALHGVVGGALGGGFVGFAPYGSNAIQCAMLGGALGSFAGNAAIQGIRIAMGDSDKFNALELLENGLHGGIMAGIMARAHNYAGKQTVRQNQALAPYQEIGKGGKMPSEFADIPLHIRGNIARMPKRITEVAKRGFHPKTPPAEAANALRVLNKHLLKVGHPLVDTNPAVYKQFQLKARRSFFEDRPVVFSRNRLQGQAEAANRPRRDSLGFIGEKLPKKLELTPEPPANRQNQVKLLESTRLNLIKKNEQKLNQIHHFRQKRRGSFDLSELVKHKSSHSHLDYLNLENIKERRVQDHLRKFDRLKAPVVFRDELAKDFSSIDRISNRPRSRSESSISFVARPILFKKGRAWTNTPPKQKGVEAVGARNDTFKNIPAARTAALLDARVPNNARPSAIQNPKNHAQNLGTINYLQNRPAIGLVEVYQAHHNLVLTNGQTTTYVALQYHTNGHKHEPRPHIHIRPAFLNHDDAFTVDDNGVFINAMPNTYQIRKHYYIEN